VAVDPRAVMRALKATTPVPASSGGYGQGAAPYSSLVSPQVASYQDWSMGRQYGASLPRDPAAFLNAMFAPLAPIQPVAIDPPADESGRPEPRRWEYTVGWNMPIGVPGSEGLKLTSFQNLRTVGQTYSVARACINLRIKEILGLDWDIKPTPAAEKRMRGSEAAHREFGKRRDALLRFFNRPDPYRYHSFQSWLSAALDDLFVIDALSVYLQPSRVKGKGVLGSNLAALSLISGETIRPLVDIKGNPPLPPNPAYQVYEYGVPRVDLLTALTGEDVADMGERLRGEYRGDQLLYLPYNPQTWTPYGFTPIEQAIVPVISGLQRQKYQLDYFAEGTVPAVYISVGDPNANANQCRELQDSLNALAGDPAWKHKIIVLPGGAHIDPQKPTSLADQFDEVVMCQVCMAFDVMPTELGIAPKVSTTMSPGAANQMAKMSQDVNQRKALKPLLEWLKASIFDYVIQEVCGCTDMEWSWAALEEGEDREALINEIKTLIMIGAMSIDEGRARLGLPPWGLPMTSDPLWATATAILPLGSVDPATGMPTGLNPTPPQAPASEAQAITAETPAQPQQQDTPQPSPSHAAAASAAPGGEAKPTPAANAASRTAVRTNNSASAAKSARLGEIDQLRRRLRKGRSIDDWQPRFLPAHLVDELRTDLSAGMPTANAIGKSRGRITGIAHVERRDAAITAATADVAAGLQQLADRQAAGGASPQFVDQAVALLREGMRHGLHVGARHALLDATPRASKQDDGDDSSGDDGYQYVDLPDGYSDYLDEAADADGEQQRGYLTGLLQDLLAGVGATGWLRSFTGRFSQYASQVRGAYNRGYGLTGLAAQPDALIVWHATSNRPCPLCAARDGHTFTEASLPGWPGDGGFGGPICEGGGNCRCYLEFVGSGDQSVSAPINPIATSGLAADQDALDVDQFFRRYQISQARAAFVAGLPDGARQRAQARDAARRQIADDMGIWPQDVTASQVAQQMFGTSTPTDAQRLALPASKTVIGEVVKSATEVTGDGHGHPDDTHHVYAYLARHYPAGVLEWVKQARWRGPVTVRLADIDMARRPGGARDESKVRAMATAIEDGTPPPQPVVLVQVPGQAQYKIADGWHRTLAFEHAGRDSIRAWIGTVDVQHGPWDEAMNQHKLNKAAAPV
jgi:hypothetical protein